MAILVKILRVHMGSFLLTPCPRLQIWEYIITFQDEVNLLWPMSLSPVKFLFVVTRYLPFVDVPMSLYCTIVRVLIRLNVIDGFRAAELVPFLSADQCRNIYVTVTVSSAQRQVE